MTHLVTGAAGFIGSHVAQHLLDQGEPVVGVDNLNDHYDSTLKEWRQKQTNSWDAILDEMPQRIQLDPLLYEVTSP